MGATTTGGTGVCHRDSLWVRGELSAWGRTTTLGSVGGTETLCIREAGSGSALNHDPRLGCPFPSPPLRDNGLTLSLPEKQHQHPASEKTSGKHAHKTKPKFLLEDELDSVVLTAASGPLFPWHSSGASLHGPLTAVQSGQLPKLSRPPLRCEKT